MPVFVVDSSTIISMASNCILWVFDELKKKGFEFVVPKSVEKEIVESGFRTQKYRYEAARVVHHLVNKSLVAEEKNVGKITSELLRYANSSFRVKNRTIKILQKADAEVAALANKINADGILTDERTLRLFIEHPDALQSLMQHRLHKKLDVNKDSLYKFRKNVGNIPVFRSVDLVALAIDKGVFELSVKNCKEYKIKDARKKVISGVLYSLKFSGCGVSFKEINDYVNLLM